MSDIVEKTLASFPKFLSEGLLGSSQTKQNKYDVPTGLQQLINSVHSAKTKTDEESVVKRELSLLQQRFSSPNQSNLQVRENSCRLLYCLTLGYDASFATIHMVKLAQQGKGFQKRLGYLMSCLLLHKNHEMLILLVNTIQKDLKSSNFLDNCYGLTAASQLINAENIPMFLSLVLEKLKHSRELVRIKAAQCLHQFFLRAPSMVIHAQPDFQHALRDKDPGVLRGIIQIYLKLVQEAPSNYVHLGDTFVRILTQIIQRSFSSQHDYHSVPLPWLQILLLKGFALLGPHSEELQRVMNPVLKEVIHRSNVKHNIAFAVLYECIITIASTGSNEELMKEASSCVAQFLQSSSHSLKYLGIKALTVLVSVNPEYAVHHQMAVVECLDGDEATQRKTLHLLHQMANMSNVQAICHKLFEHMSKSDDNHVKNDMANKIVDLAERLSADVNWYIEIVNSVLLEIQDGGSITAKLMNRLAKELSKVDNEEFEQFLLRTYLPYLEEGHCVTSIMNISLWVLGQVRINLEYWDGSNIATSICSPLTRTDVDESVHLMSLSSLRKLVMRSRVDTRHLKTWFEQHECTLSNPQLIQKYREVERLVSLARLDLPKTSAPDRVRHVDFTLSFLDDYVSASLESTGIAYQPPGARRLEPICQEQENLDFGSMYEEILSPYKYGSPGSSQQTGSLPQSNISEDSSKKEDKGSETGLKMSGVKKVWGKEGFLGSHVESGFNSTTSELHVQSPNEVNKTENKHSSKKIELAEALFQGISFTKSSGKSSGSGSMTSSGSASASGGSGNSDEKFADVSLPSADSSGWRAFHAKQNLVQDVPNSSDVSSTQTVNSDLTFQQDESEADSHKSSVMASNSCIDSGGAVENHDFVSLAGSERREIWLPTTGSQQMETEQTSENDDKNLNAEGQTDIPTDEVLPTAKLSSEDKTSEEGSLYSEYYSVAFS